MLECPHPPWDAGTYVFMSLTLSWKPLKAWSDTSICTSHDLDSFSLSVPGILLGKNQLFKNRLYILEKVSFTMKLSRKDRDFPYTSFSQTCTAPHYQHPRTKDTLVMIDEHTLTSHNYPKPTVYIRVCSCCCIFFKFRQMDIDMYPPL